jgi:hypothetical protein
MCMLRLPASKPHLMLGYVIIVRVSQCGIRVVFSDDVTFSGRCMYFAEQSVCVPVCLFA